MSISDEAVEAAARAMAPAVWGPSVWTFVAHGEAPAAARDRVRRQSLEDARRALEAAAPHVLAGASGALRDWYDERMIEEHATDVELTEYEQGREVGITEGILAASLKIGAHGND